jgi:hypothetical protein
MAMKPQLPKTQMPKKEAGRGTQRDLKAKKDPKGGAQKKEITGDAMNATDRTRPSADRMQS